MTNTDIDVIYSLLDDCFKAGKFDIVDNVLEFEPKYMTPTMALSILSASRPARNKLKNRELFYMNCVECMSKELLEGLS